MVESSKILTVSYGTFSCTLEGFDDSFGTMKAIAEYFRDLAQGDRYFGAEPPAPDAEMLTRIAEKEIARRVEARADESGIVLRAVDADNAPTPAMPPVATPPSVEEVAEVAAPVVEDIAESTQSATADMDGDVAGPEAGEEITPTLVASSPAALEVAEDMSDEMDVTAPAASFADMDASSIAEVPAHPDADSVAAKLQRIRAVVGNTDAAKDDMVEGDLAQDFVAEDVAPEIETTPTADVIAEIAEDNAFDGDDENDFAAENEAEETLAEDTEVETDSADDADSGADESASSEEAEDATAVIADDTDAEDAADSEEMNASEKVSTEGDVAKDETIVEDEAAEAAEAENTAEAVEDDTPEEAPKQNFRARILRVAKKPIVTAETVDIADPVADQSDAIAASIRESIAAQMGEDVVSEEANVEETIFDDLDGIADTVQSDVSEDALSPEDEAELMADLAEVEREVEHVAPETAAPEAPSGRAALPEADDAAMSRIMTQADEELSEPAGSRRRSAIAQLKAAVAATEAARQLGDKGDDASAKENAFRDDLNEVVRPRPASDLPRTEARTERPRPAPLKLVASQRVNDAEGEAEEAETAAVLPRRVATEGAASEAGSFADFATDMGATELPDLLEAAAAYTAFVEGVEDFSRPQIMKKVQASAAQEFSREDGLRSFGTLLRQGRISKVRNGRFQVSDQTRFKPEKKAG